MRVRLPTEERQVEIVAAALRLAGEISPALITTAQIAEEVGISQGAIFRHFETKDAIWHAAMVWVRTELLGAVQAAVTAAPSPLEGMRAGFKAHVEFVATHPGVPRFIFYEMESPKDTPVKQEVRALLRAYRDLLLALLDSAAQGGTLRADLDHDAAATLFVGAVQGLIMQSMAAGRANALRAQADAVFTIYLQGIRAGRGAK
jgi:AcrR family transcriptional regulator